VIGRRIAIVAAGPSPGSTPMIMPTPTSASTLLRVNASLSVSLRPVTSSTAESAAITTLTTNGHIPPPGFSMDPWP
jgi:hypothetical protein